MGNSLRDIKTRIVSTKKTSQITNAMNMVSASKLRKSERKIKDYEVFLDKVTNIVANVSEAAAKEINHSMLVERPVKKTGYLIITSDRGLAGPFNSAICKKITQIIDENHSGNDYVIGAVGKKGYSYIEKKGYNKIDHLIPSKDDVIFDEVVPVARELIKMYTEEKIDKLVVVYNHFINTITQEVNTTTVLPVPKVESTSKKAYEFEQGIESILDTLLPMYVENSIFGFILDSKASEHASRMTAMKSATDNATEVISQLQLIYNRARQAAITTELTDIVGGAAALE